MADTTLILVRPADGQKFRHHLTKVLHEAPFEADPNDLDVVRSLSWGALVLCDPPKTAKTAKSA